MRTLKDIAKRKETQERLGKRNVPEVQSSKSEVQTNPKVQTNELHETAVAQFLVWNSFLCLNFELRALNFSSAILQAR
jgi:hypothetical protein